MLGIAEMRVSMVGFSALGASAARMRAEVLARAPAGLFRFLSVGMAGLACHTGAFTLLYAVGVAKSPAWLVGLLLGTGVTWGLNRRLTFARTGRRLRVEALRYGLVTAVAQAVSYGVFKSMSILVPQVPPILDLLAGAVIATAFSYSGHRLLTFAPHDSADAPAEVQTG